ncbi:hypothetical protein PINS_up021229 [Pythium insidiosum]|nr:hypothetical protein PINS_up021229 [Pythium insidiosum]
MAYVPLMAKMRELGGSPVLRMAKSKAGPVVTDNGNFVLDVNFGVIKTPAALCDQLKLLPGVGGGRSVLWHGREGVLRAGRRLGHDACGAVTSDQS